MTPSVFLQHRSGFDASRHDVKLTSKPESSRCDGCHVPHQLRLGRPIHKQIGAMASGVFTNDTLQQHGTALVMAATTDKDAWFERNGNITRVRGPASSAPHVLVMTAKN
jgi:hypothetical protein